MDGNIYLIGMMGSGKSSIGRELAGLLGKPLLDLDAKIEEAFGCSIKDIFDKQGESVFREEECACLEKAPAETRSVIATGGGIVLREENVRFMKENGRIVYLKAESELLINRISGTTHRPLLSTPNWKEEIKRLLNERRGLYESAADITVEAEQGGAGKVAEDILRRLRAEVA